MGMVRMSPPMPAKRSPTRWVSGLQVAPTDGGECGEPDAGDVDVAAPALGEQDDSKQRRRRPDEGSGVVTAHGGHGQRAEKFDGDGGAQWDALDGGEERDGQHPGGHSQNEHRGHAVAAHRPQRGRARARKISAPALSRSQAVPAGPTDEIGSIDRAEPCWTDSIAARASPQGGTETVREAPVVVISTCGGRG
jgi:hypothetical protein